MPSPDDRLQELRRQRALVQQQLAFLDREIASASGEATPKPAGQSLPTAPPADGDDTDALMESYRAESHSISSNVRRGCLLAFAAAFLLFSLCVLALYFYVSRHQPPAVR